MKTKENKETKNPVKPKTFSGVVVEDFRVKDKFYGVGAVYTTSNKKNLDYLISIKRIKDGNN